MNKIKNAKKYKLKNVNYCEKNIFFIHTENALKIKQKSNFSQIHPMLLIKQKFLINKGVFNEIFN